MDTRVVKSVSRKLHGSLQEFFLSPTEGEGQRLVADADLASMIMYRNRGMLSAQEWV